MRQRRFTLADGMILVAAIAVSLAMARAYEPTVSFPGSAGFLTRGWGAPGCVIAALAPALILLRARRPRRRLRHMLLRPGMAACFALVLAAAIALVTEVTYMISHGDHLAWQAHHLFNAIWLYAANDIPWAVGGTWMTLAMMGRWRRATSWIERAGRGVGLYWVAYLLLQAMSPVLVRLFPFLE